MLGQIQTLHFPWKLNIRRWCYHVWKKVNKRHKLWTRLETTTTHHTPHTTDHSRRCWLVESWRRQIIWERRFFHISSSISQLDLSILSDLYEWDPDRIKYKIYKVYTGPIGFTKTYFSIANKQFEVIQKEERTPILNFCVTGEDFIKIKWKHKIKDLEEFPFIFEMPFYIWPDGMEL